MTAIKILAYHQKVAKLYNKKIKERSFNVRDLVLRKVTLNTRNPSAGKLGLTWEGPYEIIKIYGKVACALRSIEDPKRKILSSWNTMHLNTYYV